MKWIKKNWTYLFGLVLIAIVLFSGKTIEAMSTKCASKRTSDACTNGSDGYCRWCNNKCVNADDPDLATKCPDTVPDDISKVWPIKKPSCSPPPGFDPGDDSMICGPGEYSSTGEKPCQLCPAGTYAPCDYNMKCTKCPLGYTSIVGSTECKWSGIPDPTPDPTPGPTPDPTPGPTPGPTPDPTPGPTPDPTPGPTPGPTPVPYPFPCYPPCPYVTPCYNQPKWSDNSPILSCRK